MSFHIKKPKIIPGKANGENQKEFLENILKPLLEKASDKNLLFFSDAVHPTHNVKPCYGWIEKGKERE